LEDEGEEDHGEGEEDDEVAVGEGGSAVDRQR
jgi:hypothetical protein